METFVREPNLPEGNVTLAALSGCAKETMGALHSVGCSCIAVQPCRQLLPPVDSHADMLCHPLGGPAVIVANGNVCLYQSFADAGFAPIYSERNLFPDYPSDVLLNAVRIGKFCFASKSCDRILQDEWGKRGGVFISVRQGYAKCSTAVAADDALITADPSIAKAAVRCGLDVLKIREGFVELPGFSYGFLGGACGKLSKDTIAFAGDLRTHPDCDLIKAFLRNRGVFALSLHKGPLRDIGGILPLREEKKS